jgi:hypothetical protein
VHQEQLAHLVKQEELVQLAQEDQRVELDQLELLVKLEAQDLQGPSDKQVALDRKEELDLLVPLAVQAHKETPAQLVLLVEQVQLAQLALQA